MTTYVRKWGNSIALRIPHDLVEKLDLQPGSAVELSVENGVLYVKRVQKGFPTLEELLAQITKGPTSPEIDWGKPVGNEV